MIDVSGIARRFKAVGGILDERSRRLVAAAESAALGRGGVSAVSRATGISRQVIRQGIAELGEAAVHPPGRVRRVGGGRKKAATPNLHCAGPVRACGNWLKNCAGWAIGPVTNWWAGCFTIWVTVCKPTAR